MKNTIQSLREYQSQVDLSKLEKSIYISIDRLTVIFDSENQSLRRIFRELRKSLDNIIQEFSIQENLNKRRWYKSNFLSTIGLWWLSSHTPRLQPKLTNSGAHICFLWASCSPLVEIR